MKYIFLLLLAGCLTSCSGNENADSKPTDLDRTDNDDTSAQPGIVPDSIPKNSSDTTHL